MPHRAVLLDVRVGSHDAPQQGRRGAGWGACLPVPHSPPLAARRLDRSSLPRCPHTSGHCLRSWLRECAGLEQQDPRPRACGSMGPQGGTARRIRPAPPIQPGKATSPPIVTLALMRGPMDCNGNAPKGWPLTITSCPNPFARTHPHLLPLPPSPSHPFASPTTASPFQCQNVAFVASLPSTALAS